MESYIVYGEQRLRGCWIVIADSPEEAKEAVPAPMEYGEELIDWEVTSVEENI